MTDQRFVVLDRDGTVIVERHYLSDPDQVVLLNGAASGLRHLRELGLGLVLITNQSAIGRGLFDHSRLALIHRRLSDLLEAQGVSFDGVYYCPHTPDEGCACRKPQPEMLKLAAKELGFDPRRCFVIGDKECDIELGSQIGATTLLVRTGYGSEVEAAGAINPDYVVDDLSQAAVVIERLLGEGRPKRMSPEVEAFHDRARAYLQESADLKREVAGKCLDSIVAAAGLIAEAFRSGGKVLLCGNGGSAADCQHMAAEFVSVLSQDFKRPGLPAIALTTDTSFLTAYANDFGYEGIFERQVQALGKPGDVLVGISTSGNSTNVVRAVEAAQTAGMRTLVLTGNAGRLPGMAEVAISVPSADTQHIQEAHLAIEHVICELVERQLFPGEVAPGA